MKPRHLKPRHLKPRVQDALSRLLFLLSLTAFALLTGCSATTPTSSGSAGVIPAKATSTATSNRTTSNQISSNQISSYRSASSPFAAGQVRDGSVENPLVIITLPAESQSAGNALGNNKPIFDAITKSTGLHFEAKAGDSYASAVQGMVTHKGDLALLGPYTYLQARERGAAELLAVAVRNGRSYYFGGIFVRANAGINTLKDLKGKTVAFGDVNSTSSFNFQCAMMLAAGVDPARDLGKIYLTGSHANSLAALSAGKVDACCAGVDAFELAVKRGILDPEKFKLIAKSDPIPGSPWLVHPGLSPELKAKLRQAFADLAANPALGPNGLRGEDGRKLDRYDTTITDAQYAKAMKFTDTVTDDLKAAMLQKAAKL